MTDIADLIDAVAGDKKADAEDMFNSIIGDKLQGALDAKRVEVATTFYGREIEDENEDIQDTEDESTGADEELQDSEGGNSDEVVDLGQETED